MSIGRYREKDNRTSQTGQVQGVSSTIKTFCPNVSYGNVPQTIYRPSRYVGEFVQCWDETHKGPPWREGGPFFLKRSMAEYSDKASDIYRRSIYEYNGSFTLNVNVNELASTFNAYQPTASNFGAEAFNKFRPVKPFVDSGQWFGELTNLPANPWPWKVTKIKNYIRQMKNVGSQYLNYEFGWKPFVKDLLKMFETTSKLERRIAFIRKNNDKWLTRGGVLRNETSTTRSTVTYKAIPALSSYFYSSSSWPCEKTVITRDTIWFKARMKYFIQDLKVDSAESIVSSRLLRKLYGLEITPSLAWELIPFTWLQDWIINYGDVIANFSNSMYDNLVTKYAYVMRHRSTMVVYDETVPFQVNQPVCVGSSFGPTKRIPFGLRAVLTVECKERAGTSQYQFGGGGLLDTEATPRQERILWALGISRRPKTR